MRFTSNTVPAFALPAAFSSFPPSSRLWLFPASRPLTEAEQAHALAVLNAFAQLWKAHGVPLQAAAALLEGRLLALVVDQRVEPPSGCSIDGAIHAVQGIGTALGVDFFQRLLVLAYPTSGEGAHACLASEVNALLQEGTLSPNTPVLNLQATTLGELTLSPLSDTYLRRYLPQHA